MDPTWDPKSLMRNRKIARNPRERDLPAGWYQEDHQSLPAPVTAVTLWRMCKLGSNRHGELYSIATLDVCVHSGCGCNHGVSPNHSQDQRRQIPEVSGDYVVSGCGAVF